jgi:hypothetical protein
LAFKSLRRHALRSQSLAVALQIQAAIGATQRSNIGILLQLIGQALIAHRQMRFISSRLEQTIAHHALKRGVFGLRGVKQLYIDVGRLSS